MAIGRKPSGAYDAAYPVTLPDGSTGYASARVMVDQNGNPISGGGGGAVTIADGADVAEGATTAAAYTDQTGAASGTVVGLLKGLYAAIRGTLTTSGTVVGNVAAGATDSGNPVKIGGRAAITLASITEGNRGDLLLDGRGQLRVVLQTAQQTPVDNTTQAILSYPPGVASGQAFPIGALGYAWNGTNVIPARGDTNGNFMVSKGSGSIATAQVSVGTSSTQIVAARAGRGSVKITNLGTNDVYIGVSGVTTGNGDLLPGTKGASIVVPTNAAIFGVAGTAQTVSVMEVF